MEYTKKWYTGNTGNHQGLVIDEHTGETIAVTYKKENAPLVSAAPEMYEALKEINNIVGQFYALGATPAQRRNAIEDITRAAIAKADAK